MTCAKRRQINAQCHQLATVALSWQRAKQTTCGDGLQHEEGTTTRVANRVQQSGQSISCCSTVHVTMNDIPNSRRPKVIWRSLQVLISQHNLTTMNTDLTRAASEWHKALLSQPQLDKKLSCRREAARCFVALNISPSYSRSFKLIPTSAACVSYSR